MRPQTRRAVDCGTVTWWTNAVLAGTEPADDALSHVKGQVLVVDAPGSSTPKEISPAMRTTQTGVVRGTWFETWHALRQRACDHVRLVLPIPGDPLGMPGPASVSEAAIRAGGAIVASRGDLALIPQDAELWRQYRTDVASTDGGLGTLSEARRTMREAMIETTRSFAELQPDEQTLAEIQQARAAKAPTPPRGLDPRAAEVVTSAILVWELALIAQQAAERSDRSRTEMKELEASARRAVAVAFSHPIPRPGPAPPAGTLGAP